MAAWGHASPRTHRRVLPCRLPVCPARSTMSGKYFGKFDRQLFNATIETLPYMGTRKSPFYFNRPEGCTAMEVGGGMVWAGHGANKMVQIVPGWATDGRIGTVD